MINITNCAHAALKVQMCACVQSCVFYFECCERKCGARLGLQAGRCARRGERLSIMPQQFTDEEFQSAWKELDEPQLEGGWELFVETKEVKIYRLYDKVGAR